VTVVLDASVTLSWYFEDERTPAANAVLDGVVATGAVVPSLWRAEVANGLRMALRRKRIDVNFRNQASSASGFFPSQSIVRPMPTFGPSR
jgi:predicted nucleic acid-binding protein